MQHQVGTREEWLQARLELLEAEKELTRRSDELARRRQELPWVRIDKAYRFETDEGNASLADLFRGRSQLIVYHFMFGPDYKAGCPSCSAIADGFNGVAVHLENHDVTLCGGVAGAACEAAGVQAADGLDVSLGVLARQRLQLRLQRLRSPRSKQREGVEYNFRRETPEQIRALARDGGPVAEVAATAGTDAATYTRERPGMSAFALEDGVVYHTYSTYSRGLDGLWGMYQWLDRAPKGRNEDGLLVAPPRRVQQALSDFYAERNEMSEAYAGGCACGAIRYEISDTPMAENDCQCRDCQRKSGTGHGSYLTFPDKRRVTAHRRRDALGHRWRQRQRQDARLLPHLRVTGVSDVHGDAGPVHHPRREP